MTTETPNHQPTPEQGDRDQPTTTRRTFTKGLAATAAGGYLLSGRSRAADGPSGPPERVAEKFSNVVNVAKRGADTRGKHSINPVLERLRADDTLLYFPPGRYYMDEVFRFTGFEKFGLYGEDATLVPADYHDNADGKHKLFRLGTWYAPGKLLHVENFTVDFTADDTGVRAFECVVSAELEVRSVSIDGRHDSGMWGPGRFVVTEADGTGLVEGFRAPYGAEWSANTPSAGTLWRGPTGVICNNYNRGRMTFRDCEIGGFPDNGLYCGGSEGTIVVDGGRFYNSNGNNVRVGGPKSVVRNATVFVTRTDPEAHAHRGIRLQGTTDALVEDCTVYIDVPVPGSTGIVVMNSCGGETNIRGTRVWNKSDVFNNCIQASADCGDLKLYDCELVQDTPGGSAVVMKSNGDTDEWAMLAKVTITGTPGNKWNRAAIYNERNNVEFRAVTVDQTGGDERRALLNFGDDCLLYKCHFRTNQYPYIESGDGAWVSYNDFGSYGGTEGVFLTDKSANAYLKRNVIANGIRDDGCENLRTYGNTV